MDGGFWVEAPSAAQAARLVEVLDGFDASAVRNGHAHEVRLMLDEESTGLLVGLFDAVGAWLSDDNLGSCRVHFGERVYTLLQPKDGQPSDPREFLLERTRQLQRALDSRVAIEQAKGIIAAKLNLDVDQAFGLLRKAARSSGREIHAVAREVVELRAIPSGKR